MNIKAPTSSNVLAERTGKPEKRNLSIITQKASEVEIKPVDWLWYQRISLGKLCLITGNPGIGKSQITANIAAAITTGSEFPDGSTCRKGTVIFISAEDEAADTIVPRLTASGANLNLVHIINYVLSENCKYKDKLHFSLAAHLPELEDLIVSLRDVVAIIIDPITAYLGRIDANSNSDVRSILSPLAKIAAKHNLAIICISHNNKNVSQQAMHRVLGSVGFIAACRSAYLVVKDNEEDNKRLFLPLKNNNGNDKTGLAFRIVQTIVNDKIETSRVNWLNEVVLKTADEIMSSPLTNEDKSALEEAEEFLRTLLDSSALPATKIFKLAKEEEISKSTLRRAKKKIGIVVSRQGFSRGSKSMWCLPNTSEVSIDVQKSHTCLT